MNKRIYKKNLHFRIPKDLLGTQTAKESTLNRIGRRNPNGLFKRAKYIGFTLHGVHNNYARTHGGYWKIKEIVENEQKN